MRVDWQKLDELAARLADQLPPGVKHIREDMKQNFRSVLQSAFEELDLVTREEFDAQVAVLQRSREKLEKIEARLQAYEEQHQQ
jgi:BMFP domain-containing protein YqiC